MPRYIDADAIHYVEIGKGVEIALASDIDKIPTVSPDEVRGKGKWEDVSVHDNIQNIMIASMRCNVCKRYHNEVYHYGNPTEMARYCPVCGAKMEAEGDA